MTRPDLRTTLSSLLLLFVFLVAPVVLEAQPDVGSFGFGIILGEPTGLTVKGDLGGNNAWDAAIGSGSFGSLRIHADYLWSINAFRSREVGLFIGLGGVLGLGRGKGVIFKKSERKGEETAFGVRGVFGLNAMPFSAPVELFVEVAPVIGLVGGTGVSTDLAIGVRYYP